MMPTMQAARPACSRTSGSRARAASGRALGDARSVIRCRRGATVALGRRRVRVAASGARRLSRKPTTTAPACCASAPASTWRCSPATSRATPRPRLLVPPRRRAESTLLVVPHHGSRYVVEPGVRARHAAAVGAGLLRIPQSVAFPAPMRSWSGGSRPAPRSWSVLADAARWNSSCGAGRRSRSRGSRATARPRFWQRTQVAP